MSEDPEITDPRDPHRRRDVDVVAELDRWVALPASLREATVSHALLQAARDEIVALRATKVLPGWTDALRQTRDEALEEAAKRALDLDEPIVAAAIWALKDKGNG